MNLGVKGTLFATSYPSDAYPPGAPHDAVTNGPVLRVGPSLNWTLREHGDGPFGRADLFAAVQWYVHDRYRTGEAISGLIPFVNIGVRVGGPIWQR